MSNPAWFKYALVWDKNKCGSPGLANIRPMKVHEDILVFAPGKTTYNPQMEEGEPYARKSKNPEGYVGRVNNHKYGMKPRTEFTNTGTRFPKSILRVSRDFSAQQQVHPTQKPVPLMEWLVRTYSNAGEVVLDNCMGSGSTGVAAVMHGRRFIGIENDPSYFDVARKRLSVLT
jgi:site-specific DNA-methyltransferase (adenine-specific)